MGTFYDIAFTPSVEAVQERKGSRDHYAEAAAAAPAQAALPPEQIGHISRRDSFYMATVGESGWPYVQHRGGDPGFVRVLDGHTIGWVERRGNRQYIGAGNLAATGRVALIFVDYPNRARLKAYGHATYHPDPSPELLERLGGVGGRADGAVTVEIVGTDWNCPKYITPRFTVEEVRRLTAANDAELR